MSISSGRSSSRKDRAELIRLSRAHRQTTEVLWVVDLLQLSLEECRDQLVTVSPEGFIKKQGEAQAYANLLKLIERPAPGFEVE